MPNAKAQAIRQQITALVDEYVSIPLAPQPFTPGTTAVPPSGKIIGAQELKNMVEASLDGWLTTGRFNSEFEKKLAAFIGVKHLITVNSGSSANLVAFSTLTGHAGIRSTQDRDLSWRELLSDTCHELPDQSLAVKADRAEAMLEAGGVISIQALDGPAAQSNIFVNPNSKHRSDIHRLRAAACPQ